MAVYLFQRKERERDTKKKVCFTVYFLHTTSFIFLCLYIFSTSINDIKDVIHMFPYLLSFFCRVRGKAEIRLRTLHMPGKCSAAGSCYVGQACPAHGSPAV